MAKGGEVGMSMEFVNRICPKCKNPNYMVLLGDFSKVYKYKCMNCNRYFNDIDLEKEPLNARKDNPKLTKVIEGLEKLRKDLGYGLPDRSNVVMEYLNSLTDAIELLKEQEVRELTIDEWREWKANPKRNPICKLWKNDTSPMWILNPNNVHEPALLMGKLKLFTGKPTFEQCKAVKWK